MGPSASQIRPFRPFGWVLEIAMALGCEPGHVKLEVCIFLKSRAVMPTSGMRRSPAGMPTSGMRSSRAVIPTSRAWCSQGGDAKFDYAQFSGDAHFTDAQFRDNAKFDDAQFSGDAYFTNAQFRGDTYLQEPTFTQIIHYRVVLSRQTDLL
jgi:hypothetical protein